jgi:multidrug efflux system outer membrane protein
LVVAENQLQNQRRNFAQLLGQDSLQATITLVDSIAMDTIRIELAGAIAQALANRREVRQAEISLELADLGVAAAASSNDPVLYLTGSYTLSSKNDPSPWKAFGQFPSNTWSVQANIAFPILDGGAAKSQLDIAQSSRNIQQNNLALLRQNIGLEVEQIWRGLKLNDRRMATLALNVQIAEEALNIAELRFQHGQISSNEVEQVRSRYLATQESLNGAKVSYKIQSAALAQATGRLEEWVERQW